MPNGPRLSLGLLLATGSLLLSAVHAQGTVVITTNSKTITCTRFKQTGFWDVDIQNWSLPAECGPPLAYNAIRDKNRLPVQIAGLVSAYVFFLVATGSLLLTWGRRMRKKVESATGALKEIEMVNTSNYGLASPAASQRSWRHPFRSGKHMSGSSSTLPKSPGLESINSFDERVLQRNREAAQADMDRLYAAVAVHEEARRSQQTITKAESRDSLRSTATDAIATAPTKAAGQGDGRKNLRVQISEVPPREIPNGPISPRSPASMHSQTGAPKSPYRAIYPPYPSPGQFSYTSTNPPITPLTPRTPYTPGLHRVELPDDMYPASPPPKQVRMQIPVAPPQSSDSNSSSKSRKISQLKNLRIASSSEDMNAEDRQPLSPTTPAGMPNEPMSARTVNTVESEDYASERLDEPKPLPSSRPQLQIALPSSPKATRGPGGALALRAFQSSQSHNNTNGNDYPLSPGPVKQTILERKPDRIGRGPMTGRTPRTGVPMTPYTPYMPFTPITPVTPGLMSRKQRKERIKAEGRKVLVEEDEVVDEDEMWQG